MSQVVSKAKLDEMIRKGQAKVAMPPKPPTPPSPPPPAPPPAPIIVESVKDIRIQQEAANVVVPGMEQVAQALQLLAESKGKKLVLELEVLEYSNTAPYRPKKYRLTEV